MDMRKALWAAENLSFGSHILLNDLIHGRSEDSFGLAELADYLAGTTAFILSEAVAEANDLTDVEHLTEFQTKCEAFARCMAMRDNRDPNLALTPPRNGLVGRLREAASEIAGWGAGNEAKIVREAADALSALDFGGGRK